MSPRPGGRSDIYTRLRRILCPHLHRLADPVGGFAQCVMHPNEYVGRVDREFHEFTADLQSMGFNREPIASLKLHHDGRRSAGSWVKRASVLADRQLHVTIFVHESTMIDVFAHWEFSWIRHPIRHYRANGWDTDAGVAMMRDLLSTRGISLANAGWDSGE